MAQEQGSGSGGQVVSLFSLMANTLNNLEAKRGDLSSIVALLALFNLFSILNLVQDQGLATSKDGGSMLASKDLIGALASLLADGGKAGPELLLNLLQKQGKKINPQLLSTLLSLAGKGGEAFEGGESKPKTESPQDKRQGRGIL
ncbi:MAG: hypothetical protein QHH75_01800 [Bacillota bacterium]|nr:hypothetical protein [Bacillota bacterium]